MLQLVGQHPQRQRLRCGKSLLAGRSVDQDSRKVNDLGDPAAVFFALQLDGQSHLLRLAHSPIGSGCPQKYATPLFLLLPGVYLDLYLDPIHDGDEPQNMFSVVPRGGIEPSTP
jgi:hypothetical protein